MYAHFYHLSENPFNLTPDPKFHYINESTREALAAVLYGIKSRKGFLTLIGEAGTGKTTLLRRIVDEIEGETRVVFVFNPGVSFDELLEFLCMELGIRSDGGGRLKLMERLNQFLLEQLTDGRNVVVIIDEAQTLEDNVLEELRLLSNLETSKEKILQIVLSGQPELEEKLRHPNLRQLRQRIGVRATLKPMRSDEIRAYVETRLRSAGSQKAELFTQAALMRCWKASQGIPRVINVICDNAMMVAFAEGSDRITVSVMNAAIRDLDGVTRSDAWLADAREWLSLPALRYGAIAAAVVVGAFVLGRGFANPFSQGPSAPDLIATAPVTPPPGAPSPSPAAAPPRAPERVAERPSAPTATATERPATERSAPVASAPQAPAAPPAVFNDGWPASVASGPPAAASAGTDTPPATSSPGSERSMPVGDSVKGSMRRAEETARSTAARLYGGEPVAAGETDTETNADEPVADQLAALRAEQAREARVRQAEEDQANARARRLAEEEQARTKRVADEQLARARRAAEEQTARRAAEDTAAAAAAARAAEDTANAAAAAKAAADAARAGAAQAEAEAGMARSNVAPPSVAAPPTGLAGGLESVASASTGAARAPKTADKPVVGRRVRVARGDTVWAIAMQYYGTVDPSALTAIYRHNPGIRNANQLPVGSEVFVPFLKPEHMVDPVQGGGYRVVVAESPEAGEIAKASNWAAARLPGKELKTATKGKDSAVRTVYATGFTGRDAALNAARQLLNPASQ
jgi:general secretion pathway protein A